jgi:putative transcriptional regulator
MAMLLHKVRLLAILAMMMALASSESGISASASTAPPKNEIASAVLPAQSRNIKDLSVGKLLVASRDLADPNFAQTVVLLVRYDARGVIGLVLNRRTDVPLSQVFRDLKAAKDRSDQLYLGGPVERAAVFSLLQTNSTPEGAEHVFDRTYLIATKPLFEQTMAARPDPGNFHVYVGYAGWAKEQLQMEVALGAWFVFPADVQTVFSSDPDSLWQQMIRKTEMQVACNPRCENREPSAGTRFLPISHPTSLSISSSLITATPNSFALSSFDPASAPATT